MFLLFILLLIATTTLTMKITESHQTPANYLVYMAKRMRRACVSGPSTFSCRLLSGRAHRPKVRGVRMAELSPRLTFIMVVPEMEDSRLIVAVGCCLGVHWAALQVEYTPVPWQS